MTKIADYLAKLVRAQLNNEVLPEIPDGISIEEIVKISNDNHMNYLLLGALLKTNVDEKYLSGIKQLVIGSMSKTLMQVNELKDLIQTFEEHSIISQPMKGSVMKFVYPTPEMREMSDIDILIREEDMEAAADILKQRGYYLEETMEQHDVYIKKPYMCIEVHSALYDRKVDEIQYEYFKDLSKRVLREGHRYTYDFSKEEFYVYMMAHMAKHFAVKGCGIRNLVDIYVYNRKYASEMDRALIERELDACGIRTFVEHMERLTAIWLEGEDSTIFYDDLFEYMMNSGIYGKGENDIWYRFAQEDISGKDSKQLQRWFWFPPLTYMKRHYPWLEKRAYLLIVAWIVRAFRALVSKTGEDKQVMIKGLSEEMIRSYKNMYQKMELHFK